jgi:hypothetical protein
MFHRFCMLSIFVLQNKYGERCILTVILTGMSRRRQELPVTNMEVRWILTVILTGERRERREIILLFVLKEDIFYFWKRIS